jgi:16S rRNA A1518/A1519 N6-dimethyltransferase RsmA/KsgA/DIM1 with predicted DNA glycosylase/AP lyase activity
MKHLLPLYLSVLLLFSCTTDSYDKGEGRYSLLQADFAELTINSEKQGVSFLTDEGEQYQIATPLSASWIETADTVYRAYLYYKKEIVQELESIYFLYKFLLFKF